jgi:hypothetical protein
MEEQLSQCFEQIGRGEYFSQIESCQPFKDVYALNDGQLLPGILMGLTLGVALSMLLMAVVSHLSEN